MSWFFLLSSTDEIRSFLCCCRSNGMSQVCLVLIGSCSRCAPHLVAWPAKKIFLFCFSTCPKNGKCQRRRWQDDYQPLFCMQSTMVPQSLEDDCLYSNAQNQEIANKFTWVISRHEVLTRWFFPSSFRWLSNKQKRLNCQKSPRLLNHSVHVISYLKTPG